MVTVNNRNKKHTISICPVCGAVNSLMLLGVDNSGKVIVLCDNCGIRFRKGDY